MKESFSPEAASGLTSQQVLRRQQQGRQNTLPKTATKSVGQILRDHIATLFNLFNLLIAIALALVGAWSNMLFLLVIILNILIGIIQELHAKHLVDQISLLSMPSARVVRDGTVSELPVQELVEEDVLELDAGQQVCADSVVLTGEVEVNESLLTGESDPVSKSAGGHLLSGSVIVSGRCRARVEHVGTENYAAKVAQEAKTLRRVHSELLSSMRKVTRFTGYLIPPLGILLFLEAFLLRGESVHSAVVATSAGLLGMLPKGLVLLISVSLAAGIVALARKKVLVQELYALETLAHVDTLCLDKTGTLTQGIMRVEEVRLTPQGRTVPFSEWMGAFLHASEDNNATFQALQAHFEARNTLSPVRRVSFSSERKWSAVQFPDFTFIVGAPERLAGQGELPGLGADFSAGKRVLLAGITHEAPEPGRTPAGVQVLAAIVLSDPIRPDAAETLAYFRREGVSLKLISGDNPATAAALAAQAGFPEADRFIDMSRVTDEDEIAAAAEAYCVFGRVSPQQKRQLVQALRRQGHCVAMTGDGVNDLLALREADCSIAVASGSDAARQVSQVVLLDSDFSALPEVLSQGRRVVNNVTRVAGIFFVKTLYSILLCFVCVLLNIPFPFAPIQITLIDLIIEGYPSFFLSFEPDGRKITGRFLPSVLRRALPNALAILFCFLLWLALDRVLPLPAQQRNTLFYLLVGTVGIQAVFKACWPPNRLRVFLCVTMTAAFYTAVLLLHTVLQTALPTGTVWALLAAFALLSVLLERGGTALLRLIRPPRAERGQSSPAPQPH